MSELEYKPAEVDEQYPPPEVTNPLADNSEQSLAAELFNNAFAKKDEDVRFIDQQPSATLTQPEPNDLQDPNPEQEIVMDRDTLLGHLNNLIDNPGIYPPEISQQILRDCAAGRSFEEIQEQDPELSALLLEMYQTHMGRINENTLLLSELTKSSQQIENSGNTDTPQEIIAPENTAPLLITAESIVSTSRPSDDTLNVTVQDESGEPKNIQFKKIALAIGILMADNILFGSDNMIHAMTLAGRDLGKGISAQVLTNLGIEVPEDYFDKNDLYQDLLESLDTDGLLKFVKKQGNSNQEIYSLLSNIDLKAMITLLSGKDYSDNKLRHRPLKPDEIKLITDKLSDWQKKELVKKANNPEITKLFS